MFKDEVKIKVMTTVNSQWQILRSYKGQNQGHGQSAYNKHGK